MDKISTIIEFAPIGGGGNPLVARALACFGIAKPFVLCVLTCFNKFICHPELVSGFCDVYVVNIKSSLARDDLGRYFQKHPSKNSLSIEVI